jgi:CheY-like chemotaxis protein
MFAGAGPPTGTTMAPPRRRVFEDSPRFSTPAAGHHVFLLASMREALGSVCWREMSNEPDASALRILIVDDSRLFLDAARAVLELDGITVVGAASTSAEAIQLARELGPDGILVDIDLGDESGLDLAREFASSEAAPVVLISAYPEAEVADLVAASSAIGFVSKSELSARAVSSLIAVERDRG